MKNKKKNSFAIIRVASWCMESRLIHLFTLRNDVIQNLHNPHYVCLQLLHYVQTSTKVLTRTGQASPQFSPLGQTA